MITLRRARWKFPSLGVWLLVLFQALEMSADGDKADHADWVDAGVITK